MRLFAQSALFILLAFVSVGGSVGPVKAQDEAALWAAVASGEAVAVMRHALAPGTGDPNNFDVNNCATQRNLSQSGRDQAQRIGERFKANGITEATVLTSQWCRCRETAELLGLGPVRDFPDLNSFFRNRSASAAQTAGLIDWMRDSDTPRPAVMVTHQVNITALTDIFPSSGEIIFVSLTSAGEVVVLGRIATDA